MPSTRQKGRDAELRAKKWLEEKGYECQLAPMPTRYSHQNDLFGLWDVLAVNAEEMLAVQVKSLKVHTYGKQLDKHRAWVCPPSIKKMVMIWPAKQKLPEIILL